MSMAVKGIYKSGKIKLLEELKGIEEADVIVVVTKKRKKEKKKDLTTEVRKALKEVKLMRKGKLPEREWHQDGMRNSEWGMRKVKRKIF